MSQTEHCKEQISLDIWPLVKFEVDFCLIDSLGEGSFGKVYLVQCVNWGKIGMKYAAKHSRCPKAKDKLRVREEIEILSDLRGHNNVVEIIVAYEGPELIIQGELSAVRKIDLDDFRLHFSPRISIWRLPLRGNQQQITIVGVRMLKHYSANLRWN